MTVDVVGHQQRVASPAQVALRSVNGPLSSAPLPAAGGCGCVVGDVSGLSFETNGGAFDGSFIYVADRGERAMLRIDYPAFTSAEVLFDSNSDAAYLNEDRLTSPTVDAAGGFLYWVRSRFNLDFTRQYVIERYDLSQGLGAVPTVVHEGVVGREISPISFHPTDQMIYGHSDRDPRPTPSGSSSGYADGLGSISLSFGAVGSIFGAAVVTISAYLDAPTCDGPLWRQAGVVDGGRIAQWFCIFDGSESEADHSPTFSISGADVHLVAAWSTVEFAKPTGLSRVNSASVPSSGTAAYAFDPSFGASEVTYVGAVAMETDGGALAATADFPLVDAAVHKITGVPLSGEGIGERLVGSAVIFDYQPGERPQWSVTFPHSSAFGGYDFPSGLGIVLQASRASNLFKVDPATGIRTDLHTMNGAPPFAAFETFFWRLAITPDAVWGVYAPSNGGSVDGIYRWDLAAQTISFFDPGGWPGGPPGEAGEGPSGLIGLRDGSLIVTWNENLGYPDDGAGDGSYIFTMTPQFAATVRCHDLVDFANLYNILDCEAPGWPFAIYSDGSTVWRTPCVNPRGAAAVISHAQRITVVPVTRSSA